MAASFSNSVTPTAAATALQIPEILLEINSHLSLAEDIRSCMCVNTFWNQVITSEAWAQCLSDSWRTKRHPTVEDLLQTDEPSTFWKRTSLVRRIRYERYEADTDSRDSPYNSTYITPCFQQWQIDEGMDFPRLLDLFLTLDRTGLGMQVLKHFLVPSLQSLVIPAEAMNPDLYRKAKNLKNLRSIQVCQYHEVFDRPGQDGEFADLINDLPNLRKIALRGLDGQHGLWSESSFRAVCFHANAIELEIPAPDAEWSKRLTRELLHKPHKLAKTMSTYSFAETFRRLRVLVLSISNKDQLLHMVPLVSRAQNIRLCLFNQPGQVLEALHNMICIKSLEISSYDKDMPLEAAELKELANSQPDLQILDIQARSFKTIGISGQDLCEVMYKLQGLKFLRIQDFGEGTIDPECGIEELARERGCRIQLNMRFDYDRWVEIEDSYYSGLLLW